MSLPDLRDQSRHSRFLILTLLKRLKILKGIGDLTFYSLGFPRPNRSQKQTAALTNFSPLQLAGSSSH